MSRALREWIGPTPDTPPPPRVRVRCFDRAEGRCAMCARKLWPGDEWDLDHVIAICIGGENRESNLAVACAWCHCAKTSIDVAIKSRIYKRRASHIGAKRKRPSFATNKNGTHKKFMDGRIERR